LMIRSGDQWRSLSCWIGKEYNWQKRASFVKYLSK
jgi:hypothetical protein